MNQNKTETSTIALESIISAAVKLPGVKVNRNKFLADTFSKKSNVSEIIDKGPVAAGIPQEEIEKQANKLMFTRTGASSIASFAAGIPGGFAMAATIPADIAQFFGMALRLAQELSYLYGASDLWDEDQLDDEKVRNQLILYCGVMFGVSGAVSGVRVLSTQIAKTTLKKLPQKALTKTFWYPIVKQIGKAIGIKVTKTTVASGVSKAVPVIGGVISGTLNYASMMPMANRLNSALDKACFDYSEEEYEQDIEALTVVNSEESSTVQHKKLSEIAGASLNGIQTGFKKAADGATALIGKLKTDKKKPEAENSLISYEEKIEIVRKLKGLVDEDILTVEEFEAKKKEILDL